MYELTINDYDRQVYAKELKDFLPDTFIDFHTHIGKKEFEKVGKSNGGSTWTAVLNEELLAEDLQKSYERLFPSQKVIPVIFGDCSHRLDQVNGYVLEKGREYDWPMLYRTTYDMPADQLEEDIKKGGFLGIKPYLTFCPSYIPISEIRIFDFLPKEHLEAADRNGWIVMLHIPRSGRLKDKVNLAQLMEIEAKYPNLKLVVAHIGRAYAKEDIGDAFEILGKTKNMVFDFTANVCDDAIKACLNAVGSKRLLFGSDLPIAAMRMYRIVENGVYYNVVPKGLYDVKPGEPHMRESEEQNITLMIYEQLLAFKRCAAELKLSDRDVEDVLYGNAKRLMGR